MSFKQTKIAIIGAGFTGTSIALEIFRHYHRSVEIYLFEKTGVFCQGEAYRTTFSYHLLNVRARDMSAFEDEPEHFSDWLKTHPFTKNYIDTSDIAEQFVPRLLYHHYLWDLLQKAQASNPKVQLYFKPYEVYNINKLATGLRLHLSNGTSLSVDQAILALGNGIPFTFPFPVAEVNTLSHSWDYQAPLAIPRNDSVLIIGTGLSMVDTILTLHHQQHQGKIYALSRRGLLPLAHSSQTVAFPPFKSSFNDLQKTLKKIRQMAATHDWRTLMQALRIEMNLYWQEASIQNKKQFLRHLLPYWNIHRHCLPQKITELLANLRHKKQVEILSGRVLEVKNQMAKLHLRHQQRLIDLSVRWLINCTGPSFVQSCQTPGLLQTLLKEGLITLNELKLGLNTSIHGEVIDGQGQTSSSLFAAGPLLKGLFWECTAVPDIRKKTKDLALFLR